MTAAATASRTEPEYQSIPLDWVDENPHNPRKDFDPEKLEELADSIRAHGVVVPILVRPKGLRYELVGGHRRCRAARLAKQTEIRAIVRTLSDRQVAELAIIDNIREDISALEEGEAYQRLHQEHGLTADEIATKVGRTKATVYGRMKLCGLTGLARTAVMEGDISPSIGLLLARLPTPEMQDKVLDRIHQSYGDEPPYRAVADLVQHEYMLRLKDAAFDVKDATLVPAAGACTVCPKRAGSNPELFADVDVKSGDVCTDTSCFRSKVTAAGERIREAAEAKGQKVLSDAQAKKALAYGGGYVSLKDTCYEDPKHRTYAQLLGKAKPETVLAIDGAGAARELVARDVVHETLAEAGHEFAQSRLNIQSESEKWKKEREKTDAERELAKKVWAKAVPMIVGAAETMGAGPSLWFALATHLTQRVGNDTAQRRGYKDAEALRKKLKDFTEDGVIGVTLELLLEDDNQDSNGLLPELAEVYDVDLKALKKEAARPAKAAPVAEQIKVNAGFKTPAVVASIAKSAARAAKKGGGAR